jgi:hypothetical protein
MAELPEYVVLHRVRGRMVTPCAAEVTVRDFPPIVSDEPPSRGGEDRGPTPLEFVLVALCA